MSFTRKHFGVPSHLSIWRSKIREIEINRLQETESVSKSIQGFSSRQEGHVAQKMEPLNRSKHTVVLLAPFQSAEVGAHNFCPSICAKNRVMSSATSIGDSSGDR